jgi:hypothetical protein
MRHHPLLMPAALLGVALLATAQSKLAGGSPAAGRGGGAARGRGWLWGGRDDKGAEDEEEEEEVEVGLVDLWMGRAAMMVWLWLLVLER